MQYLSFWDWLLSVSIMSSRFIYVAAWQNSCLKAKQYSIVHTYHYSLYSFIYWWTDAWVASTSWYLWIILQWTQKCKSLFKILISITPDKYPEVGLLTVWTTKLSYGIDFSEFLCCSQCSSMAWKQFDSFRVYFLTLLGGIRVQQSPPPICGRYFLRHPVDAWNCT